MRYLLVLFLVYANFAHCGETSSSVLLSQQDDQVFAKWVYDMQWNIYNKKKDAFVAALHQKYPDAGVDRARWEITPDIWDDFHYNSMKRCICLPQYLVSENQCLAPKHKDYEWASLHELGHFNNRSSFLFSYRSDIKAIMLLSPPVVLWLLWMNQSKFPRLQKYIDRFYSWHEKKSKFTKQVIQITATVATIASMAVMYAIANAAFNRLDEHWADDHANKHADKQALLDAHAFFTHHAIKEKTDPRFQSIFLCWWYDGLAHPPSQDRAHLIAQVLKNRFGV
jgi:hypothetical protein